jgi:ABC-type Fe3+ transport system substrate-binding protein
MYKWILLGVAALALTVVRGAAAADFPKATQKTLAELKLDASVLEGLDAELDVPKAWLDAAGKEDKVVILGTWANSQFPKMTAPFRERYPFVKLNYSQTGTSERGMKVAIALREGRVIADVLTSIADAFLQFEKMKAFADLRNLPGFGNVAAENVASDGTWVSHKLSFRCMGYNTANVKKQDLPREWNDILTNPRWRDGKLAISNHPNAWLLSLWGVLGDKWGAEFTRRLFEEVQPQRRKEGMTASTSLTLAGEFDANIPAPEWRVHQYVEKGAPIGYHCPTPVPTTVSQIVMLEKSPHKNGARLFINWMLSREGQLLQYAESDAVPIHKALQSSRFVPFSDTIAGKRQSVRDDALLGSETHKKMLNMWNAYWTGPEGRKK